MLLGDFPFAPIRIGAKDAWMFTSRITLSRFCALVLLRSICVDDKFDLLTTSTTNFPTAASTG